jgi:hypothetical protein
MTLKPRHPITEDQFFKIEASPAQDCPLYAGMIVYISGDRTVDVMSDASEQRAYGFLMQKVKDEYTDFPTGFRLRGDLGSSDAFVGDPVGILHGRGTVFETDQYNDTGSDGIAYNTLLYPSDDGKLEDTDADSATDGAVAVALNSLTATETAAGEMLLVKSLI